MHSSLLQRPWWLAMLCLTLLAGCDLFNTFEGYQPEVSTQAAYIQGPDSVVLVGEITLSHPDAPLDFVGFVIREDPTDPYEEGVNLFLEPGEGPTFTAFFLDWQPLTTYYVTAMAATEYGYDRGETVSITTPLAEPPVVPCTPPNGYINTNNTNFPISSRTVESDAYAWRASFSTSLGGGLEVALQFKQRPMNGVYRTVNTDIDAPQGREVVVKINYGFALNEAQAGDQVYVTVLPDGRFELVMCDLRYRLDGNDLGLKGKMTVRE